MLKYAVLLVLALVLSVSGALGLSRDAGTATSSPPVVVAGPDATGAAGRGRPGGAGTPRPR